MGCFFFFFLLLWAISVRPWTQIWKSASLRLHHREQPAMYFPERRGQRWKCEKKRTAVMHSLSPGKRFIAILCTRLILSHLVDTLLSSSALLLPSTGASIYYQYSIKLRHCELYTVNLCTFLPVANLFLTRDIRYRLPTSSTSMPDSEAPEPTNWTARLGGGPRGTSRHCQLAHRVPEPGHRQRHR